MEMIHNHHMSPVYLVGMPYFATKFSELQDAHLSQHSLACRTVISVPTGFAWLPKFVCNDEEPLKTLTDSCPEYIGRPIVP
jgi:hypothetical protein